MIGTTATVVDSSIGEGGGSGSTILVDIQEQEWARVYPIPPGAGVLVIGVQNTLLQSTDSPMKIG